MKTRGIIIISMVIGLLIGVFASALFKANIAHSQTVSTGKFSHLTFGGNSDRECFF